MEKVVILVPDNHTPKSAVMDVLSDMEKCADGRGHFQTATTDGIHYSVQEANKNDDKLYILDDYREVRAFGIGSMNIPVRLVSDVDMDEDDIIEELVLRGVITATDAHYVQVFNDVSYDDIWRWIERGVEVIEL